MCEGCDQLPETITFSRLTSLTSPDSSWFRGESIDFVKSLVSDQSSPMFDFLDFETVGNLVGEQLSGRENRRLLVWPVLNFDAYLRSH